MPYINETIYESGSGSGSFNLDNEEQKEKILILEIILVIAIYFICAGLALNGFFKINIISREDNRIFTDIVFISSEFQEGSVIDKYLNKRNVDTGETCPICLQDSKSMIKTDCDHVFCKECIKKWLDNNNSCPCCRKGLI